MIKITPKNKKLLKSSQVRKYMKFVNEDINKIAKKEKWSEKITEAMMLGAPLLLSKSGKMIVVNDYYKYSSKFYRQAKVGWNEEEEKMKGERWNQYRLAGMMY